MKIRGFKHVAGLRTSILPLLPGQLVRGQVLKKLRPGRFRVRARGRLFDAASDLPLEAGQKLLVRVEVTENRLLFRVQQDADLRSPSEKMDDDADEMPRVFWRPWNRKYGCDITA